MRFGDGDDREAGVREELEAFEGCVLAHGFERDRLL